MSYTTIAYIAAGAGILAGITIVIAISRKKNTLPVIAVETITLETVIQFFKQPGVLHALGQDKNLVAVVVKEEDNRLILACFNKTTNEIHPKFVCYTYKTMDEDLQRSFGDKNMIVLQ